MEEKTRRNEDHNSINLSVLLSIGHYFIHMLRILIAFVTSLIHSLSGDIGGQMGDGCQREVIATKGEKLLDHNLS
ncbi:hypothetical protein E2C01_083213 [Portunus trituberculatus]|uniref:Uncharacterized protein n=1 Tax=Portunus trituberculatus TaxID=210409 RepID=A0A5B7IWL7_PORTR|nr:hypothetical protein [Portunus trituberculatus]